MKILNLKQGSCEWLSFRREKITAGDASIILELSPYKTINQLFKEKIHGFEQVPNPWMLEGLRLEPIALEKFEQETGMLMFSMVGQHETLPWMAASFDGVTICRNAIVEIKCNGKKNHALALKGKLPIYHQAQIQHQLAVAGIDFAHYYSYSFEENQGIILEVKRNQLFIDEMIDREFAFWNSLQTQKKIGNDPT